MKTYISILLVFLFTQVGRAQQKDAPRKESVITTPALAPFKLVGPSDFLERRRNEEEQSNQVLSKKLVLIVNKKRTNLDSLTDTKTELKRVGIYKRDD
ncbi:hypothetical protein [Gilvibacter sp.]|uniref:hypothetical protein n=1 Tax=Gilvibacter sp. TaxID=2729997 RepID=UPI0035BE1167